MAQPSASVAIASLIPQQVLSSSADNSCTNPNNNNSDDNSPCVCYYAIQATNFLEEEPALDYIRRVKKHTETIGALCCQNANVYGRLSVIVLLTKVRFRGSSLFNHLVTLDEINRLFTF